NQDKKLSIASALPWAKTSTLPSGAFRTQPVRSLSRACCTVAALNPTPWTLPCTVARNIVISASIGFIIVFIIHPSVCQVHLTRTKSYHSHRHYPGPKPRHYHQERFVPSRSGH